MGNQQHKKMKVHDQMEIDRFGNLPDPIIHHILSLMDTKYAVQTCVLSKNWKHHWTHIHTLNFDDINFKNLVAFGKFVRHVLRHHKPFKTTTLRFHSVCRSSSLVKRVFNYAKSHRVKELDTSVYGVPCQFEHGTLRVSSLTTLQICRVCLTSEIHSNDLFSGCYNLKNLVIDKCRMEHVEIFNISAPQLVNLTISYLDYYYADRKKNRSLVISATGLKFFFFEGMCPLLLNMSKCRALEKVHISMCPSSYFRTTDNWKQECISDMLRMAEEFSFAKSLTFSIKFPEVSKCSCFEYTVRSLDQSHAYHKYITGLSFPFSLVRGKSYPIVIDPDDERETVKLKKEIKRKGCLG